MIKQLCKVVFLCVVLSCFQAYGEDPAIRSDILSKYKNLPEYIEIANLRWKIGFAAYFQDDGIENFPVRTFQVPLLLELQVPFSVESSRFKWLVQIGGGWMREENRFYHEECDPFFTPDPLGASFGDGFFKDNYNRRYERATNKKICLKKRERVSIKKDYPYFLFQPGLMYDFGLLIGFLRAGILVGGPRVVGAVASISVGTLDWWDVGFQTMYYDRFYFGLSLTIGSSLKKWQVKNPYIHNKEIFNSD